MDELWDIARVATYLGVSERTVYTKVRSGDLPAIRVGRLWRVRENDLRAWLGESDGRTADAPDAPPSTPSSRVGAEAALPSPYPFGEDTASLAAEGGAIPDRVELERLLDGVGETLARRLTFVALLGAGVRALGWSAPVVVGGHAVEFYTAGRYATQDIDLAGASEPVAQVLSRWGFERQGRHWYDSGLGIVVEVPGRTLPPEERDHVVAVEVAGGVALVLGIEDLIVDRLAACVHWRDEESCRWAKVLLRTPFDIDAEYLDRRVREEDVADAFILLREDDVR